MPDGQKPVPAEMSALQVHAFGETPRLGRVPVPEPGPDDVLVEIAAGVVSHHDVSVARGDFRGPPELPYVPGLEGAGRVVATGSEVDAGRVPIGAPVRVLGGGLGAARSGTWAEYAAVTAKAATPVPEGLDLALAAAFGSVAATAWTAVFDVGALQAGERLGVTGASGAVGSLAVQLAMRGRAGSVVAWTRSPERVVSLPDGVHVATLAEPVEPVDVLVDTIGGPRLAERIGLVRPGGRVVLVGYTAGMEVAFSVPRLLAADVAILPLNMVRRRVPRDVESGLLADAAAGRLRLPVETVAPEDVADAIERLAAGATFGRLVVAW